jgi:DNA invertase Pin-like site-specific DNA recombinase
MPRKKATPKAAATAYSYVRFSSPEQGRGDSVRRQEELRSAWLKRSGAVLDESVTLRDEGVSAFSGAHRENPDRHALAAFLELVRRGRIQRGSYLVVESLDRLSREHIRPALTLLLNLIDLGVRVVQLLPVEAVYDEQVEPMALMQAIMELSRGHSESRMKSERVGAAWQAKKRRAAEKKEPVTARLPAWLDLKAGKVVVNETRAAVVRRIYAEAAAGHGIGSIGRRLNVEGVPPIGRADYWARSYIAKLLSARAVVGEYQPHTRRNRQKRRPEGKPIAGYFPAIITDDEWHAARAALASRRQKGGRPVPGVNLFQGLWHDARDGASLHLVRKDPAYLSIANYKAKMGVNGSVYVGFPLPVFEEAILGRLREIDPREILPEGSRAADRVLVLTGKLADVEGRVEALKAKMVENDIAPLVDVLRTLESNREKLAGDLAEAQREAASPLSGAWGEARSLLDTIAAAADPNDARVRLRGAIRRIVESVWCLFITRVGNPKYEGKVGRIRLAAVQFHFAGGAHRDYLIVHRPAHGNAAAKRGAVTEVMTFAKPAAGHLDLRKRKDAEKLAGELERMELPKVLK